jgi:exopolysaccharide biosynthesis polyprenyl glycosylphosphotransferase
MRAERVLFVGPAEDCERERRAPAFTLSRAFRDVGFVDLDTPTDPRSEGTIARINDVVLRRRVDTIVLCGAIAEEDLQRVVDASRAGHCRLLALPLTWDLVGVQPLIVWREGQALLELTAPAVRAPELVIKRVMDFVSSSIGLFFLSPLLALIAVLIRLDSPGPAFFASERWGKGGRRIQVWKFRTMVVGATHLLSQDPELRARYGEDFKLRDDPRVTRVGRWLRRWSLDELPQLFNVLLGEMSLVGPRPKLIGEEERYGAMFGFVLSVPPRMTGLWQVSGRNDLSFEERVALDLDYVRRCSLWFDVKLLVQTLPAVVLGVGAR